MSAFYDRQAATAQRLLAQFGQPVTVSRVTGGTEDPLTGEMTGQTTESYTPNGVLLNYSVKEAGDSRAAGNEIRTSDRKLLLAPFDVDPVVTDLVTVDGGEWTIISIKTLRPAGQTLLHEIQVRK
ncbi:hypothetical protein [Alcanivorax sp.]|uniref:hypothetical protein n=1 Tax=Alcanivorax sp. TaxID=1872427 RepID=UPI003BA8F505